MFKKETNPIVDVEVKTKSKKQKFEELKRRAKNKFNYCLNWISYNKEALIIIIPATITVFKGTTKVIRTVSRNIALKQEKRIKDTRIYDRSMGKYIELKRALKNSDMKTILERRDNGEKLSNILMDMDLIK